MNVSAQNVASLVDNMIERVRRGEMSTDQGLSFLEMKYNMLLSYLINLSFIVLRKCSGEKIEGDPCIDRLIEIRTVLEKIRPIDHKLKYQIDKLVKTAVTGQNENDPTSFRANPDNLAGKDSENSDSDDSVDNGVTKTDKKPGVYAPPKLSAVHYTEDIDKKSEERNKRKALSSAIMQDLREEYLDSPVEVKQGSRAQQILSKQQQERQEYEENYLTRLPITKADKHKRRQLSTLGTLGDELTSFNSTGNKRKRNKSKGKKNFKKKRFHWLVFNEIFEYELK